MKLLILGINGMLGHQVFIRYKDSSHEVFGTTNRNKSELRKYKIFSTKNIFYSVDALNFRKITKIVKSLKPDFIINCISVIKQKNPEKTPPKSILINSVFPHKLAELCTSIGSRLIHISTDSIFSEKEGKSSEESRPQCSDFYSASKFMGEVNYGDHLTIRTCIVGRELGTKNGLVEWFLSQKGPIKGFSKVIFTPVTTKELSKILINLLGKKHIRGIVHIASEPISKLDFLKILKEIYVKNDVVIERLDDLKCDRSLDNKKMKKLGITLPNIKDMIIEMKKDDHLYDKW